MQKLQQAKYNRYVRVNKPYIKNKLKILKPLISKINLITPLDLFNYK
jgi:hypothetical protein